MFDDETNSAELRKTVVVAVKKLSEDGILDRMETVLKNILQESDEFREIENSLRQVCERPGHINYGEIFHEVAGATDNHELESECLEKQILKLLTYSSKMQVSPETKKKVQQEWKKIFKDIKK